MVQTFAVNAKNDIFIAPSGSLSIAKGAQGVKYACASAAKAQLAEMVLAINNGIPNFQTVWVGSPNLATFESYLRKTLRAVKGVVAVNELTTSYGNNKLSYRAVIKTAYGEHSING